MVIDRADCQTELSQGELAALLAISRAVSTHRDRDALFTAVAAAVDGVVPADRLIILVPDSQSTAVSVYAVRGARKLFEGERIPEGSVPAWVIRNRQAMLVSSPEQVRQQPPSHAKP